MSEIIEQIKPCCFVVKREFHCGRDGVEDEESWEDDAQEETYPVPSADPESAEESMRALTSCLSNIVTMENEVAGEYRRLDELKAMAFEDGHNVKIEAWSDTISRRASVICRVLGSDSREGVVKLARVMREIANS